MSVAILKLSGLIMLIIKAGGAEILLALYIY